jgi:uncharacterized protein (TIGR02117 family)
MHVQRDTTEKPMLLRIRTWLLRTAKILLAIFGLYWLIIAFGLIPVNTDFTEDPDGVAIFVVSNDVHAEIIVPVNHQSHSWQPFFDHCAFQHKLGEFELLGFGWGDREFFLQTPTWSDLKISTACNAAFLPSDCVMHVSGFENSKQVPDGARRVMISNEQYLRLIEFIESSFTLRENGACEIGGSGYHDNDCFFDGEGTYFALNTCNSWVGRGLKVAGVRVGWMTPLPKSVFLYLPR